MSMLYIITVQEPGDTSYGHSLTREFSGVPQRVVDVVFSMEDMQLRYPDVVSNPDNYADIYKIQVCKDEIMSREDWFENVKEVYLSADDRIHVLEMLQDEDCHDEHDRTPFPCNALVLQVPDVAWTLLRPMKVFLNVPQNILDRAQSLRGSSEDYADRLRILMGDQRERSEYGSRGLRFFVSKDDMIDLMERLQSAMCKDMHGNFPFPERAEARKQEAVINLVGLIQKKREAFEGSQRGGHGEQATKRKRDGGHARNGDLSAVLRCFHRRIALLEKVL